MAQQRKKKRRRKRHDPDRAAAAAQREEAKRRMREERRLEAIAAEKRRKRVAFLRRWGGYAVVGVGVMAIALLVFRPDPEVEGVLVPDEIEAVELAAGGTYDYQTATPTSGPYLPGDPACGIFDAPIEATAAATAIYHGAVVVWHDPALDASELESLTALTGDYDSRLVVSPNAGLDSPIVATAWNRLLAYDTAAGVDEFVDTYRGRGPGDAECPVGT